MKYLVVILGKNYCKPMEVYIENQYNFLELLSEESKKATYTYCLYEFNTKYEVWCVMGYMVMGKFYARNDYIVPLNNG